MEKKEYDIIKMVQHGKYCERIQDTIFGQTLIYWLKYHPQTAKEELWNLMRKMLLQITWFHKYGEKQTYGYLSPYSVIVKEDEEIYLLDLEAEKRYVRFKAGRCGNTSQIPKFTGRKESVRQ